jgi:hypothetical protein
LEELSKFLKNKTKSNKSKKKSKREKEGAKMTSLALGLQFCSS